MIISYLKTLSIKKVRNYESWASRPNVKVTRGTKDTFKRPVFFISQETDCLVSIMSLFHYKM